ncbi:MAG: NAD-dependent deacylase [Methylophaga sp.]|nr:NAD-dependent deacylase [Methylophaga sp.]
MSTESTKEKIVIFTGAGISAESGLATFRDSNGLWNNYSLEEVATPSAWNRNPKLVLDFYNHRRKEVERASPNSAHESLVELEERYDVTVVTQNVDDLHERAGSSKVIHLHGEITKARSCIDGSILYDIGYEDIKMGDLCELRSQKRPHIVWFGEEILNYEISVQAIKEADKVMVIGTSLAVFPAASIVKKARYHAEKVLVTMELDKKPFGYRLIRARATAVVPCIVGKWIQGLVAI